MADLEDAEAAIAEQEDWGLSLTGLAVKRVTKAARAIRIILAAHGTRLTDIESRLSAVEALTTAPAVPTAPDGSAVDPPVDPAPDPPPDPPLDTSPVP